MYVVGRDWPDQLYATNASWPVANIWHYRPKDVVHRKQTPHNEVQQAYELGVRRELKKQVKELKRQLFKGILDVRGSIFAAYGVHNDEIFRHCKYCNTLLHGPAPGSGDGQQETTCTPRACK